MSNTPSETRERPSKPRRHLKAIVATALVGIAVITPLALLLYLADQTPQVEPQDLGEVTPFVFQDEAGRHFTPFDLREKITVIATFGDDCTNGCPVSASHAERLATFVKGRLIYDHGSERTPVRLVAVGRIPGLDGLWRRVSSAAAEDFRPASVDVDADGLVLIDQEARFRAWLPLADPESVEKLKPLLSRLTINHYMRDYLAKRTFFRNTPKSEP